ncbi:hypothetical protein [Bradyrhizobium sp.]|uniref:hypothetical protein n=1 Tax=Bradyrhizobium sp. TaxID=376 RepID=UPI0039E71485
MNGPVFDSTGKQVAMRIGNEVWSVDRKKVYRVDASGNLCDAKTGKIKGHLVPGGALMADGRPPAPQTLF